MRLFPLLFPLPMTMSSTMDYFATWLRLSIFPWTPQNQFLGIIQPLAPSHTVLLSHEANLLMLSGTGTPWPPVPVP